MSGFPVKTFRQILDDTKSIQSKLSKNFIVQCKKHNMIWIQGIIQQFYRIFSTKETLKIKVNAMYAIQYFVQLAEYPILTMFQVYILPLILQIAEFKGAQQNQQTASRYFLQQGYSASIPNIKQLSYNYVSLAQKFIFNTASIRPHRTFQAQQMTQISDFKKAANKLLKHGIKQKDRSPDQDHQRTLARQQYFKNLQKFQSDSQSYLFFYLKKVDEFIIKGSKYKQLLDFRKIMKYGDLYITSAAIEHCCESLENNNFQFKKNALLLIHDFVIWGDIQAIMMINYAECIEEIFNKVKAVKGNLGTGVGEDIYPQVYGDKQQKKSFYCQFLKCLYTWSICVPKNNFDTQRGIDGQQQSIVFLRCQQLRQKQFKFPQNPLLPKQKKQFQQNFLKNKQRNSLLMKQIQTNFQQTLSASVSKRSSLQPINKFQKYKSKNSLIKQQRQSQFITSSQIKRYIKQTQNLFEKLVQKIQLNQIQEAHNILQKLNQFCNQFESKLQFIQQSLDQQELEKLYIQGAQRIDRIQAINDHFQDYKNKEINLMKLEELLKEEISKPLDNRTSRYVSEFKSRKSRKSMSKSFGSMSQNFLSNHNTNNNNKSIELKNYSHDRYKAIIDQVKMRQNQENKDFRRKSSQIMKDSRYSVKDSIQQQQSAVSKSSRSKTKKTVSNNQKGNQSEKNYSEKGQDQESYDFGIGNYGFRNVNPSKSVNKKQEKQSQKQVFSNQSQSQSNNQKTSKKSKISQHRSSQNSQRSQNKFQKKTNIYTQVPSKTNKFSNQQQIQSQQQLATNKKSNSQKQKSFSGSQLSSNKKEQKRSSKIKPSSMKDSQHSNFTKSRKLNDSQSFMIASDNLKKINQVSNTPSSEQINNLRKSNQYSNNNNYSSNNQKYKYNQGGSQNLIQDPYSSRNLPPKVTNHNKLQIQTNKNPYMINQHKLQSSQSDPKQLTSFNITNIAGFSKQYNNSSLNKISSIEQKKFKFEMFNSQDRQLFNDQDSVDKEMNEEHQKIKQELKQQQNPGFGIVFKNKSNLIQKSGINSGINGNLTNSKAIGNNNRSNLHQINQQLKASLSPNNKSKISSKDNSKLKQSRNSYKDYISGQGKQYIQFPPTKEKSNISNKSRQQQENNVKYNQAPKMLPIMKNIYTTPSLNRMETFGGRRQQSSGSISRDNSLNKSNASNKSLRRSQLSNIQNRSLPKVQFGNPSKKQRQQFHQSSFVDSSQDTPRILQRSKDYYRDQNSMQQRPSKTSIYLQKNTSPKHQKISFTNSNRNILSKLAISQRDQKQQYDRSNLTPSEVPKSRMGNTRQRPFSPNQGSRNPSTLSSKQKIKSVLQNQKSGLRSNISKDSAQLKKKIQSSNKIEYLANKQMQQIKKLQQRLQKVENDSKFLLQFQRSNINSPQMPRYIVSPRSPRFRNNPSNPNQSYSSSISYSQRRSFINGGVHNPNNSNNIYNTNAVNNSQTNPNNQAIIYAVSPPHTNKHNFDLNSSFSRQYLITPQGKLLKKKYYQKYFQQLKSTNSPFPSQPDKKQNPDQFYFYRSNIKKHLLRNKQLIHKTQNMQIGITILRQRNRLKIIYFITPQKPIESFQMNIQEIRKLKIKCSQKVLYNLQQKKQYKIYVSCEILQFPYLLPKISFLYKNLKKTFFLGQGSTQIVPQTKIQLLLPVYFLKFIQFQQISNPQISQSLYGKQIHRTQQFPINLKFIKKPHQINDYIPNLTLLSQNPTVTIYGGKGVFFKMKFVFKINIKINHFMYIQGVVLQSGENKKLCQNILEWFMVCLEEIFFKEIKLNKINNSIGSGIK